MKSVATKRFWKAFDGLPPEIQSKAKGAYREWKEDPHSPRLQFKRVQATEDVYSIRIGLHWRALAIIVDDTAVWFWIGSHSDYDKEIGP